MPLWTLFELCAYVLFFNQMTACEMRISDWSSDVCSSDIDLPPMASGCRPLPKTARQGRTGRRPPPPAATATAGPPARGGGRGGSFGLSRANCVAVAAGQRLPGPDRLLTGGLFGCALGGLGLHPVQNIAAPFLLKRQIGRAHVCTPVTNAQI